LKRKGILKSIIIIVLLFLVAGVVSYGFLGEPNLIEVKKVVIYSETLSKVLAGYTLIQLSDLHISRFGQKEKKILGILENINPDFVFLTGDYIVNEGSFGPVMEFLEKVPAKKGGWAVIGNTDYSNEAGSCILCHEANSKVLKKDNHIKFLRNNAHSIEISTLTDSSTSDRSKNKKRLSIIGLDDPITGRADLKLSLQDLPPGSLKILLSHSPDIFKDAVNEEIDLVLAGHTHGGQIFFIPQLTRILGGLDGHNFQYINGIYTAEKTIMYVNSGLGMSIIPIRLGVRPEITVFEFRH
jgi:predicted MPP superfamily phosphohydrolase